ncbi:MAG: hypothetical protein M3P37_05310 [Actinomycetota bacterium]|nr:hypothetical protein [Actinomycetota bacterium]
MSSNLIRWGGLAAMLAGALFVAADLLSLSISPKFPSSESLGSEPYAIQSVLKLAAAALLLLGLFGLHARQAEAAGPVGTMGALAAFCGTALVLGSFWATAFFAPAMAAANPASFDALQGPPGRLAGAFVVSMATFVLGWMLFGAATWRARVYPRAAALLLVFGSPLALGTLMVVGFPTGVFFSAAVAWMGYTLWSEKGAPVGQPARVS